MLYSDQELPVKLLILTAVQVDTQLPLVGKYYMSKQVHFLERMPSVEQHVDGGLSITGQIGN